MLLMKKRQIVSAWEEAKRGYMWTSFAFDTKENRMLCKPRWATLKGNKTTTFYILYLINFDVVYYNLIIFSRLKLK